MFKNTEQLKNLLNTSNLIFINDCVANQLDVGDSSVVFKTNNECIRITLDELMKSQIRDNKLIGSYIQSYGNIERFEIELNISTPVNINEFLT